MLTPADTTAILSTRHPLRAGTGDQPGLPTRFKILDWGDNKGRTTGALIKVNEITLSSLAANQEKFAHDLVELDYEHQSVPGHPDYQPAPRHSAAHGKIEVVEGEGVFLTALSYTPSGKEHALNYPDVSAVAHTDKDGNLVFVSSVALTQSGDVAGMTFAEALHTLSASNRKTKTPLAASAENNPPPTPMENKYRETLIKLFGLKPIDPAPEVTEEQITAAVAEFAESKPTPMSNKEDEAVAMSARIDALEKSTLIHRATAAGKVIPLSDEIIATLPLSAVQKLVDETQPSVPLKSNTPAEKPGTTKEALSADQKSIAKQLGLTEEEYLAAKA